MGGIAPWSRIWTGKEWNRAAEPRAWAALERSCWGLTWRGNSRSPLPVGVLFQLSRCDVTHLVKTLSEAGSGGKVASQPDTQITLPPFSRWMALRGTARPNAALFSECTTVHFTYITLILLRTSGQHTLAHFLQMKRLRLQEAKWLAVGCRK